MVSAHVYSHGDNQRSCRVEKYRPVTLDDVVSHKDITNTSDEFVFSRWP